MAWKVLKTFKLSNALILSFLVAIAYCFLSGLKSTSAQAKGLHMIVLVSYGTPFFSWCIPTSPFIQFNGFYTCSCIYTICRLYVVWSYYTCTLYVVDYIIGVYLSMQ